MNLMLAEDDEILADALSAQLRGAGFEVEVAVNGPVAEYLLLKHPFDLAILDIGLPMMDGLTVLQHARAARPALPVVLLTALDSLESRVAGLNAGADDYITKPFDFPELEARVRALLRRAQPALAAAEPDVGLLKLDRDARRATLSGDQLDLSPREWTLLSLLVNHRDKVVTKDQIAEAWSTGWGELGGGNSTEVYIHRLRKKLEGSAIAIRTVRGLGYLLEVDATAAG